MAVKFKKFYYENLNNLIFSIHVKKYSLETDGKFNEHVNKLIKHNLYSNYALCRIKRG